MQSTKWNPLGEVYLLLHDYRFSNCNFTDFEQFKIDSHFADFGKVKINPNCSYLLTLCRSQAWDLAQVIFNDSISSNQELGCPVNK